MRLRALVAFALAVFMAIPAGAAATPATRERVIPDVDRLLPEGFVPAVAQRGRIGSYVVSLESPSLADRVAVAGRLAPAAAEAAVADVMRSQTSAIGAAEALGGVVGYRWARVVNGFSVRMSPVAAAQLAAAPGVRAVAPSGRVYPLNSSSVPFIGAPTVWKDYGAKGKGIVVAVIDSGIDYTHADFGGPGTEAAYTSNDPEVIEAGTFPTGKVIGGYDIVGDQGYDPFDSDPTNDTPNPDPDPLDRADTEPGGHGTHVSGTCCGKGVPGTIGAGVAPKAKILIYKVFDADGCLTADILEALDMAVDPNGDGSTRDAADVVNLSVGEDYTYNPVEAEAYAGVDELGVIVAAAAGNAGNQPAGGTAYVLGTPGNIPTTIAAAASIDQFDAQQLEVPSDVELPDGGPIVWQDWSASFDTGITGEVVDAREFGSVADPDGAPAPSDRLLCDATPSGSPFDGKIALVFKGPFADGDCLADDKVLHAQEAGATAVILWDGFGGLPSSYSPGTSAASVTIPAVSLSGADSEALAAAISPNAPGSYNETAIEVTIGAVPSLIPGYEDRMAEFSSEGPARVTSALKPDISAPGYGITSAFVGTGTEGVAFSGTSMATPHIAGVAALLRELHPNWEPAEIKALMMNQATQKLSNLDGSHPVAATIIGSGRVQVDQAAAAVSLATPGSLSFGLQAVPSETVLVQAIQVKNHDDVKHDYAVSSKIRYSDYDPTIVSIKVKAGSGGFHSSATFSLKPGGAKTVRVQLTLDPTVISPAEQEYGWAQYLGNVDGNVIVEQSRNGTDKLHVPWHTVPMATSNDAMTPNSLDLTAGPGELELDSAAAAGAPGADLYLLGATDPQGSGLEEDIAAIGARSFTGAQINGQPAGLPTGVDPLFELSWVDFLTANDAPTEPVEFVVASYGVRSTTENVEVDVLVDVGADGVFADATLKADVVLVKPDRSALVCAFVLPSTFETCDATYFADYSAYNGTVIGLPADARLLGLGNNNSALSYSVAQCSGTFDAEERFCETVGAIDPATGTYGPTLDATDPALTIDPLACEGFFGGGACTGADAVAVGAGSAAAGDDPSILAIFPNNPMDAQYQVVDTTN